MRVPIVDIGNSKGIRIPQAVLKQVSFGEEIDMVVSDGKITLRRSAGPNIVKDFATIAEMEDVTIQRALLKISGTDMITALVGADDGIKKAIYRNLSEPVKNYVISKVEQLEHGDARDLIIERSRNILSEALMEVTRE